MNTHEIQMIASDFRGDPYDNRDCPMQRAIKRCCGREASVGDETGALLGPLTRFRIPSWVFPRVLEEQRRRFFFWRRPRPFSFTITET